MEISNARTVLLKGIASRDLKLVDKALRSGLDVNSIVDQDGWPIVKCAAYYGNAEIMARLLEAGVNLDAVEVENGGDDFFDNGTAVMIAAKLGHTEVLTLLIDAGANVNIEDDYRNTALIIAADEGKTKSVSILVNARVNLNARSWNQWTALMYAVGNEKVETVRCLLNAGADIDLINLDGETALDIAMKKGNDDIVKLIKEKQDERQEYVFDLNI